MSTRTLPCLLLFGASLLVSVHGEAEAQPVGKPRRITAAYFGESVTNPGGIIGYEAAFYQRRMHELFGGAHIGGYNSADPPHYGLLIYIEGGYRLNFNVGFFLEARVALGYVNVNRESVIVNIDGTTSPGPNQSINYLAPIGMGGIGWDFLKRTRVPISLFADVGGMGRYAQAEPFSGGLIFTAGLAYQFGTGRPRPASTDVPPTPIPVAPSNLDGSLPPGVTNDVPPSPPVQPVPLGPAEPAPTGPVAPYAPPPPGPEPPQLPPPPTVPGS